MAKRLIKVTSCILIILLILPSVAKLQHKHHNLADGANNISASFNEVCCICSFEFPLFVKPFEEIHLSPKRFFSCYSDFNITDNYSSQLSYILSLRAPPAA
jgi:hypothetical protein